MKYFSLETVEKAYQLISTQTNNKFWGILAITSSVNRVVEPSVVYHLDVNKVSTLLEEQFCLLDSVKEYSKHYTWNVLFSNRWASYIVEKLLPSTPNIYAVLIWYFRREKFPDGISVQDLLKKFLEQTNISADVAKQIFSFQETFSIQFDTEKYLESDLLNKLRTYCNSTLSYTTITAEKNFVVANPGELSRAPFVQTLYASQGIQECMIITQFNFNDLYMIEKDKNNTPYINSSSLPLQKISYGAPGTGKSHGTNKVVRSYKDTVRTTFHPDSDYSTFVGSYKPTTTKEPVLGLFGKDTVQLINPLTGEPLETTKIVYKFIKQAFLKAYIRAWKKMCNARVNTQIQPNSIQKPIILSHTNGSMQWEVTKIDDLSIYLTATEVYDKEKFKKDVELVWKTCWNNNTYQPNLTTQNRPQICVCNWMAELQNPDFEFCWEKFLAELSKGEMELNVNLKGDSKPYFFCIDSDNSIKLTRDVSGKKETVLKDMLQNDPSTNYQQAVANYLKEQYNSSTPNEAWDKLKDVVNGTTTSSTTLTDPLADIRQFLVIEEINRGNCAQIFGDLFQLLDRKNGYSEYPIEADEDIQKALLDENPDDGLSFGKDGLTLPEQVKNELRRVFEGDANPDAIIEKICMGKVLALPSNLHIWATMNTSDQSLFPIDSAFKRRWDWEYVPIKNHTKENWKIKIENETYDWWKFLVKVNNIINELTSSEDKKLGYFFAKAQNKVVDTNTMVNKVFFYLWNDIFKDFDLNSNSLDFPKIKDNDKERPYAFGDFFSEEGEISVKSVSTFMKELVPEANETPTASGPAATEETEKTEEPEELTAE